MKSMKKSLLHVTFAALLLVGCAQNEITDISPDAAPPVGFKVFTDAQTRGLITNGGASSVNATGIQTTGFGVFAYYTGQSTWASAAANTAPNFMYNQKVAYSASEWGYTPVKYWPNTEGDKISFFAYAPHSTTTKSGIDITPTTTSTKGAPTMRFTLQTAPADMVDLVATNATQTGDDKTIDVEKKTSKVSFKLKHVLTRASFKAKLDASLTATAQTHVIVTGMRILGTEKRDATNTGNSVAANAASKFYSAATYQWSDGTWASVPAPTVQAAPYELKAIMPLASKTDISAKYTTQGIELPQAGTEIALLNTNQYLFLIPPHDATTPTGITAPTDVRMQIDYDILTVDASLAEGHSVTSATATVSLPNGTLKRASAYNFTFTVGLEKVQVSASVEDWATETGVYVPSADATNVATIITAIGTLNTAKGNDKNCNYFVINCTGGSYGSINLASATVTNFKSGDRIELNFTSAPGISGITLPTGWKADKTTLSVVGKIILKKD